MATHNIRVIAEKFRAVNKADIIIDGITLVAGENGSGKSSISKLLYFLYKTVSNYDRLVKKKLVINLRDVFRFLEIIQQEIGSIVKDRGFRDEFRKEIADLRRNLYSPQYLDVQLNNWLKVMDKFEDIYKNAVKELESNSHYSNRLNFIMRDILKDYSGDKNEDSFSAIKFFIESKFKEAMGKIESRPTSLFIEELESVFSEGELPKRFEVLEYDDLIVSLEKDHLSIPYSIQNAIYIDTPMMISIDDSHNIHWNDLNELLLERKPNNSNSFFTQLISKEITQGIVESDDATFSAEDFKFKRNDGALFNLLDVATGIKAFSILQMLLKNGLLTDKTLLIIDEPESNLHPQWIIEYARIIVLLNREIGVKFFLATHNPDMVSAIRYISEKENILNKINFYLAEKSSDAFEYNYKFLDKEIDPIFESFNIAIDKINRYGI